MSDRALSQKEFYSIVNGMFWHLLLLLLNPFLAAPRRWLIDVESTYSFKQKQLPATLFQSSCSQGGGP